MLLIQEYFDMRIPMAVVVCLVSLSALDIVLPRAFGDAVVYTLAADTSSVDGQSGYIDIQFDPGFQTTQSAFASISNLSTDANLDPLSVQISGDVSGALPAGVTIGNGTQFNDYFEGLIFGNRLSFTLSLSGPALVSPDGSAASGSTFGVGFYDSTAVNPILTTNVTDGFAAVVNVNLDGTTTPIAYPSGTGGGAPAIGISAVPEPSSISMLLVGLGFSVVFWCRKIGLSKYFRGSFHFSN